jgi:hypothetical protein
MQVITSSNEGIKVVENTALAKAGYYRCLHLPWVIIACSWQYFGLLIIEQQGWMVYLGWNCASCIEAISFTRELWQVSHCSKVCTPNSCIIVAVLYTTSNNVRLFILCASIWRILAMNPSIIHLKVSWRYRLVQTLYNRIMGWIM